MNDADSPLALIAEDDASVRHALSEGKLTLGSAATSGLLLREPDVSPQHAQLVVSHGHVTVSDLNSASGTYVNERRLGGPAPLRPGDVLRVASRRFRLDGPRRHEVLILGGGFGGAYTALELAKRLRHRDDVGVTLISRDNYFLFQPMLPELVSGSIETLHILTPLRRMLPRTQVFTGEVQKIDFPAREVHVSTGLEDRIYPVTFDSLVVALGSVTDLSRFPGLTEHAIMAKTVGDGFGLRNHALDMLEMADAEGDPEERGRMLTFAVAGRRLLGRRGDGRVGRSAARFAAAVPGHRPPRAAPGADPIRAAHLARGERALGDFGKRELERKGIEVLTDSGISALTTPTEGVLRDGSTLPTRTLAATIGNRPHPLVESLPCCRTERGAVIVDEYLQTTEPGLYALGDVAAVPDLQSGGTCLADSAVRDSGCQDTWRTTCWRRSTAGRNRRSRSAG